MINPMPMTISNEVSTKKYTAPSTMAMSTPKSTNSSSVLQRFARICCWSVTYRSKETCGAERTASSSSSKNSASEKSPKFAMRFDGTVCCVALYWATVEL